MQHKFGPQVHKRMLSILFLISFTSSQECCSYLQSQITRLESRLDQNEAEVNQLRETTQDLTEQLGVLQSRLDFKYQLSRGNFATRETIIFDKLVFDNSQGAYSPENGTFTIPVSGRYLFIGYVWMNLAEGDTFKSLRLMVNGRPVQFGIEILIGF